MVKFEREGSKEFILFSHGGAREWYFCRTSIALTCLYLKNTGIAHHFRSLGEVE